MGILAIGGTLFGIGMALPLTSVGLFVFAASFSMLSIRPWPDESILPDSAERKDPI